MVAHELDLTSISRVWWQSLRPDLCGPPRPIRTGTRFLFCAILFLLYPCAPPSCVVYCYLWLFYHIYNLSHRRNKQVVENWNEAAHRSLDDLGMERDKKARWGTPPQKYVNRALVWIFWPSSDVITGLYFIICAQFLKRQMNGTKLSSSPREELIWPAVPKTFFFSGDVLLQMWAPNGLLENESSWGNCCETIQTAMKS